MKIIELVSFDDVKDFVKTEEVISSQLKSLKDKINTEYVYVSMPIADLINKQGISYTQNLIDQVCKNNKEKLFFVCQHIDVKKLNFYHNLVFTPHATILDSYVAIPHYTCNFDIKYSKPWKDRKYKFGFVGSFSTHPIRSKIYNLLKNREDCLIVDTGGWHFQNEKIQREKNEKSYIEVLGDTKYSLCPRGTGPSTIRLWESIAMNSKPVIISDYLKIPMVENLDQYWIKIPEKEENYDLLSSEQQYDNKFYWDNFSNENLSKSVVNYITNK